MTKSQTAMTTDCKSSPTREEINKKIIEHYNYNDYFYEYLWANKSNLGFHYGFWEKDTKNRHEAIINENRRVCKALNLDKSDIVLDAGCGIGGTCIWIAENYGCKVTGITISENQAKRAEYHIKRRKTGQLVNVEKRDFCETEYPDSSFSKVFGIESICYAFDLDVFAREAFRILKPGGRLAIADGYLYPRELQESEKELVKRFCVGWGLPGVLLVEDVKQRLFNAGFREITVEDVTEKTKPSSKVVYRLNKPFYLPFKILCSLHILPRTHLDDIVSSLIQYEAYNKNICTYALISAKKPV